MNKKTKKIVAIISILFLLIALIVFSIIYVFSNLNLTDEFLKGEICGNETPCETTTFVIENGSYDKETIYKLAEESIIKNPTITYYWNKLLGKYSFYAGKYELPHKISNRNITLDELFAYLSNPNNSNDDTVTIQLDEGDIIRNFARKIASELTLTDIDSINDDDKALKILDYWNDNNVVEYLMDDYPFITEEIFNEDIKIILEGYLFPDTYEFYQTTTIDEVTRKILDRTLEIYENNIDKFNKSKLSVHQIFTLASIVQSETGDVEDSDLVAGTFLNRIENPEYEWTGGRLESTVTACYAFGLSKDECNKSGDNFEYTQRYDVYNTYLNEGFPPGPVCCPNEMAINAALNPNQEAGYYFFTANKCEGGTAFAKTLDEHNYNIAKYTIPCSD